MFIILFAIIFVPQQSNELIEKMAVLSVYCRNSYKPLGNVKHVVICGDMSTTFLTEFFTELFHEDHEDMNLNAIILQPGNNNNIYFLIKNSSIVRKLDIIMFIQPCTFLLLSVYYIMWHFYHLFYI
jgi:hypothetical protein